jgi:hypothetical protein
MGHRALVSDRVVGGATVDLSQLEEWPGQAHAVSTHTHAYT